MLLSLLVFGRQVFLVAEGGEAPPTPGGSPGDQTPAWGCPGTGATGRVTN